MSAIIDPLLRVSFDLANRAAKKGNMPFGALLTNSTGEILLEAENTVLTSRDCTGHAELNLIRRASCSAPPGTLKGCTLYASTEPCPMCASALFWSGISRLVYALSAEQFF